MLGKSPIPAMVIEEGGGGGRYEVHRGGPNVWWIGVSGACGWLGGAEDTDLPSSVLRRAAQGGAGGEAAVAKVELDLCGAWLTVSNAGPARPLAVRRAGWVDLRGHPTPPLHPGWSGQDDRIGLGPADTVLLRESDGSTAAEPGDDTLFDLVLRAAGAEPTALVRSIAAGLPSGAFVGVGVPGSLGANPAERVASATGVPEEAITSLGYPLGDLQPDLWSEPPPPPRLARLRLTRDRSGIPQVRSLLDRLLASWRLDGRVEEADLKLIATELATNAVVHADFPDTITIRYLGEAIRIEVRDTSPAEPATLAPSATRESGRGMHLVEVLASSWGVTPRTLGKEVWCEVPVS